jgi:nucleoside-diphosphate-sugar epimerase
MGYEVPGIKRCASLFNTDRIESLGWRPSISMQDGIARTY